MLQLTHCHNLLFIIYLLLFSCWSDFGRLGNGEQIVSLGKQCYSKGTVMHELLHTLGFYHEQSRADRDHYIIVHYDNIKKGIKLHLVLFL